MPLDRLVRRGLSLAILAGFPSLVEGGIPLYRNGAELAIELGVKVQLQYFHLGGDGFSEEDLFFRRLRPALDVSFSESWVAEAEFDFGKTIEGEEIEFKDLFLAYRGPSSMGLELRFGNEKPPFSRQFQSSSKSLTLVDRGFVGIDDFGTLDRLVGARIDGRLSARRIVFGAAVGLASHEPDASQMEFESPLNAVGGANRGWTLSGRIELQPLGEVDYDQGDFGSTKLRLAVSAAAYLWRNDGSGDVHTKDRERADLEKARGIELGAALRGLGLSADLEIHWIRGGTTDPEFSGGLYQAGFADLTKLSLQSGYMVVSDRLQVAGGYDRLDAATYGSPWERISFGGTYYFRRNQLKVQLNYVLHRSFAGIPGDDPQAFLTQLQLGF
jgi:hypothetical protein